MSSTELSAGATGGEKKDEAPTLAHERDAGRRHARERRRKLARAVRRALLLALVVAATVVTVLALRPRPVPVDVATATRGPLAVLVEESGVTRVEDRYLVSAPVTGHVSRLALEPGDAVHAGDPIAEIAPAESPLLDERTRAASEARLSAATSALGQTHAETLRARTAKELADQELARTTKLVQSGAMTPQALEQAQFSARMRAAEAQSALFADRVAAEEVRIAEVALGRGATKGARALHVDVKSPISGRVLRVLQKSAGIVTAGAPLVELGDPTALEVVVDLLTTDAVRVSPGTAVTIDGWGGDHALAGQVRRIEPSAFTRPSALGVDEQRVDVVIALTDPPASWAALGDGFRVETELVLWKSEDVLTVPHGAIFRHGEGWATYRVVDGVARLTEVRIGHRGETRVEILSGLSPGAVVAVHPGDRVKDGARVEIR